MSERKRPRIPDQVQRELWARTAGRCQFRGCNELLYVDDLSKKRSNLAKISHIIAFSPEGPRGHPTRSIELAKDISNLMLTCGKHAKIIDDKDKEADYPVELLTAFKQEHENRIRRSSDIQDEAKAHVLLVKAAVNTRLPDVLQADAYRALTRLYPAEENALKIDLTSARAPLTGTRLEELQTQLEDELGRKRIEEVEGGLAVFALAPIPLLVDLGCLLGDLGRVHLFQRHRAREDWAWPSEEDVDGDYYELTFSDEDPAVEVVVVLSVSSEIRQELVDAVVPDAPVFTLKADAPSLDFLGSEARVKAFGVQIRILLEEVRKRHPELGTVHLFAAVPAPIAIEFGRHLHGRDAPVVVYEFSEAERNYAAALVVDRHRSAT